MGDSGPAIEWQRSDATSSRSTSMPLSTRILVALLLLSAPVMSSADRITRMSASERCVYVAQLAVAGYHYFLQGKARTEIPIHWHGDETQHEMEFVNRTLDEAFTSAERDRRERPSERILNSCSAIGPIGRACQRIRRKRRMEQRVPAQDACMSD